MTAVPTVRVSMKLPGPDRKRTPKNYQFIVTHRMPEADQPGCVMAWAVHGGRSPYQVALERNTHGEFLWHCTCADAVYRGSVSPQHRCKHVQGLTETLPAVLTSVPRENRLRFHG